MSDELRLNRDQLETALGDDPDVIRTFEDLLRRLSTLLPFRWASEREYDSNRIVEYLGDLYRSLQDTNINEQPDTSTSFWRHLGVIEEQGSNSNGSYIVFSSGIQVCWHYDPALAIGTSVAYGSLYQIPFGWTYPRAFSGTPSSPPPASKRSTSANWTLSSAAISSTTGSYRIMDVGSWLATTMPVQFFAIGTAS